MGSWHAEGSKHVGLVGLELVQMGCLLAANTDARFRWAVGGVEQSIKACMAPAKPYKDSGAAKGQQQQQQQPCKPCQLY